MKTSDSFNFQLFLAELERSEGIELVKCFETAMTTAGISDADRDNMTPEAAESLLATARELHAKHAGR
jgi:hypothetical protein